MKSLMLLILLLIITAVLALADRPATQQDLDDLAFQIRQAEQAQAQAIQDAIRDAERQREIDQSNREYNEQVKALMEGKPPLP